jgi:hypothetical protein
VGTSFAGSRAFKFNPEFGRSFKGDSPKCREYKFIYLNP